jgi:hypothetical protein
MGESNKASRAVRFSWPAGAAAAVLSLAAVAVAQTSEIDAFQRAVDTQSPEDARAFIDAFGSSHLVPDLIELLEPEAAQQVCGDLRDAARVQEACRNRARTAVAETQPSAPADAPTAAAPRVPATQSPAAPPAATATAGIAATAPSPVAVPPQPPAPAPASSIPPAPPSTATAPTASVAPAPSVSEAPASASPDGAPPVPAPAPSPPGAAMSPQNIAVAPLPTTPPATAPAAPLAAAEVVVPVSPEPALAARPGVEPDDRALQELVERFDRGPFSVDHVDRRARQLVVTYAGKPGRFVICGDSFDSVGAGGLTAVSGDAADRVSSRIDIRVVDANGGPARVFADTLHVVMLRQPLSRQIEVLDVRLRQPARTSDGRTCWSTGEMERLAELR